MKRKTLAGIMSLAVIAAVAVPVHAEDKTTELNTNVPSKYELTIPMTTEIDFNTLSTDLNGTLKVTGNFQFCNMERNRVKSWNKRNYVKRCD